MSNVCGYDFILFILVQGISEELPRYVQAMRTIFNFLKIYYLKLIYF